jgi:hypothetical protein
VAAKRKSKETDAELEAKRWEFCPYCFDGFPLYLGPSKQQHQFECSGKDCGAYFKVDFGKGEFDKRLGMQLDPKAIYWDKCLKCDKSKPVKLVDFRFICKTCMPEVFPG